VAAICAALAGATAAWWHSETRFEYVYLTLDYAEHPLRWFSVGVVSARGEFQLEFSTNIAGTEADLASERRLSWGPFDAGTVDDVDDAALAVIDAACRLGNRGGISLRGQMRDRFGAGTQSFSVAGFDVGGPGAPARSRFARCPYWFVVATLIAAAALGLFRRAKKEVLRGRFPVIGSAEKPLPDAPEASRRGKAGRLTGALSRGTAADRKQKGAARPAPPALIER